MPIIRRTRNLVRRISQGDGAIVAGDLRRLLLSDTDTVGLRWDVDAQGTDRPEPLLDLRAVPLDDALAAKVFDLTGLKGRDRLYLERRRAIWERGFEGGYVAIDTSGRPAYLQFYIPSTQAQLVRSHWGKMFQKHGPGTVLTEGAWVVPEFRKRGLMAQGLDVTLRAVIARSGGATRQAITYVYPDNRGALAGCRAAGYEVYQRRTETWRLGRQSFRFEAATEGDFPEAFARAGGKDSK